MQAQSSDPDNQSQENRPNVVSESSPRGLSNNVTVRPVTIECLGRKWAVVRFSWPLDVAQGCGTAVDGCFSYLIGVSHARLWFIGDGRAVESVRHGFVAWGLELVILPWETPADALRRHTFPASLPPAASPVREPSPSAWLERTVAGK
jgi:hypothetical protein